MSCAETISTYALRSLGIGERLLPRSDITLCEQFTLIGSGMLWNIYFGLLAIVLGFFTAQAIALAKASNTKAMRKSAEWFIFIFRGSPLFIQFFFGYFVFLSIKQSVPAFGDLTDAWLGAAIVLWLNTTAYSAEIFYGALMAVPKGDTEAADAYGFSGWPRFRRIVWPTMLRLAWPAYTNEAIFIFHSTTLVFVSGFPAIQQKGDALYYASYFADKTFNPFIPYPILAGYFVLVTLCIITVFGLIGRRLNRHLPVARDERPKFMAQIFR
ncbi:ABC transporter permease [Celeribacter halophilus]|jgi:polar amino acid transport system permease protein|uniref:ABC transporter permease n=1 Tax=Celeribacter halophilus TaxID=576117 RepID=UPI001C09D75E|nr:ABC transporter permease subunit [Celeribacter halophilus]MBU2889186.1 ABC transporter permease subunit [Celeribacter halophilus]MDO6510287.1 ABC transporter permease subunit [Celeribacter halophilus]